jgi:regulator of sigma E protease
MTHFLLNFLVFLVSVLLLITIHEFGHFWVAKRLGVKVVKFSVGFGRAIWHRSGRDGTEYAIAILPLGGYVRLLDERDGGEIAEADRPYAFNRQALWKRALIILAGPGINVLFAIFAFWIMWMAGVERVKPVVGEIVPNSIAAQSGLPAGAEIFNVDGQKTLNWQKINILIISKIGDQDSLIIKALIPGEHQLRTYSLPLKDWKIDALQPDPLKSLGIMPYEPKIEPVIGKVLPGSPAASAELQRNDRILTIAGQSITRWSDIIKQINAHPSQFMQMTLQRGGQTLSLNVKIGRQLSGFKWIGYMGIEPYSINWPPGMVYTVKFSPAQAFLHSLSEIKILTQFNYLVLGKMIMGKVSTQSLGGPISIYQTSSLAYMQGLVIYIGFLGLLSLMLALINILPIPGLDGGHLLFFVIEGIIRRPLSTGVQVLIIRIGFLFLLLLMVQATLNDFLRVFAQ